MSWVDDLGAMALGVGLGIVSSEPVEYSHTVTGVYNPATGSTNTTTTVSALALKETFSAKAIGNKFNDSVLIQGGDIKLTIPAGSLPFEPATADRVKVGRQTYAVKGIIPQFGADQVIAWILLVRR